MPDRRFLAGRPAEAMEALKQSLRLTPAFRVCTFVSEVLMKMEVCMEKRLRSFKKQSNSRRVTRTVKAYDQVKITSR